MIGKIKPTVAIRTEVAAYFSESEPVDIQDFCWNGGRFHDYLPLTSLESGIVSMLIRDEPRPVKSFSPILLHSMFDRLNLHLGKPPRPPEFRLPASFHMSPLEALVD